MDKQTFLYLLVEAVVFLIPVATLFIKLGKYVERMEKMEGKVQDYPEWKAKTDEKVVRLEADSATMTTNLQNINNTLIKISAQVDLLLENKIKVTSE